MHYCDLCRPSRPFVSRSALRAHRRDSPNHNCCGDNFPTWSHMEQHWIQSRNHAYCQRCEKHFDDDDELYDHYESSHYFCKSCRKMFAHDHELQEHYRETSDCPTCGTHFQNDNNLRHHLNSSAHRPRNTRCPTGCGESFISISALILHLESGACSSGTNRNTVSRLVRQLDTNHVITDPSHLGTSADDDDDITYPATAASWNGSRYECYLCHEGYLTLQSLNQHLASPTHKRRFYICPRPSCGTSFVDLGALCQHIESGKCGVEFSAVQATIDSLLGQMGSLTL